MKKVICTLVAIPLALSMSGTAYAFYPTLKIPTLPTVPEIKVEVKLPDNFWSNWFKDHPLEIDFSSIKLYER